MSRTWIPALAGALLIGGCAVGPDYVRPEPSTAASFAQLQPDAHVAEPPVAEFWASFEDPVLMRLVEGALAANTDLRAGLARLDAARAAAGLARLDYVPGVTAGAAHSDALASADQAPGVPRAQRDTQLYRGSFDAFWELDLFGRVRRNVEASRAGAEAAEADLRALQVIVAAEVARTYFELRGRQEQLRIARRNAGNQQQTLALTEARLKFGRGSQLDTDRARAQLSFTQSRIPALEAAVAGAAHRLAVLNGREPNALRAELEQPAPLPALPARVAVGTPAELLRRRPDVRAAERQLAAATARIGVATADLFPRVTLSGSLGTAAADLGDLFSHDAETYAFGPAISWAFLDLGRVRTRIRAADAGAEAQLALYEGTVLRALEEAETTLISFARARTEREHLDASAAASASAAQLARQRFEAGAADFLQVLDAERTQLEAEDRLAQSSTRATASLIAVYKAVAGGWPARPPERTVAHGRS